MSDQTIRLMQLIKEGRTCNEICNELKISNKQLFNNLTNLRNKGLFYRRKYYENGDIIYRPITGIAELKKHHKGFENDIITSNNTESLKCILISDLHLGNSLERPDLIKRVYEYCAKNDIHIIFCCGDMIDGAYNKFEQNIESIFEQIEHFIKDYPFDKNILTFGVGGDHDFSALYAGGQDLVEIIKNYRHDIIIGGYNNAFVNIKNDKIHLYHHHPNGEMICSNASITAHGHPHNFKTSFTNNLQIVAPALSGLSDSIPTAVEMTLDFEKGLIRNVHLKQIFFAGKPCILNEINYQIPKRKVEGPIKNEEAMPQKKVVLDQQKEESIVEQTIDGTSEIRPEQPPQKKKEKVLTRTQQPSKKLNALEKFKKKYGYQ